MNDMVVFHIAVKAKTGPEYSDAAARDLLYAAQPKLSQAGCAGLLNRSFAVVNDGQVQNPIIVMLAPKAVDLKKQATPDQFFSETLFATFSWRQVTEAEDPKPLPSGVQDLGKQVDVVVAEVKYDAKG